MRARGILLTVLVLVFVLFAAINWTALTTPVSVDLLLVRLELPLGAVLAGLTIGLAVIFFFGALFDRSAQLTEIRRLEKQLEKARAELDARRSREIGEVKDAVHAWGASLEKRLDERVSAAESSLRGALTEVDEREARRFTSLEGRVVTVRNELAADVGEAEDTIKRLLDGRPAALEDGGATGGPTSEPDDATRD